MNVLRVTGDPAEILSIRLRKTTKSDPYSCDDDGDVVNNIINNNNNKTNVVPLLIVATGTISKLFINT